MSGLQQAQLLYAAAVRSRVPPWAPFLQFPNVFGAPFLSNRHQLVNTQSNELSTSTSIHQPSHRNQLDPTSEDSNDERGMFFLPTANFCVFLLHFFETEINLKLPTITQTELFFYSILF